MTDVEVIHGEVVTVLLEVRVLMTDLAELPSHYKVIMMDPPWAYTGDPDKPQAAGKHYNMMSYDELAAMPVRERIVTPGVVLVWATSPKLDEAVDLIRAWGLHYRGIAYVWVKTTESGKIIHGQGVRPSFTKPTTELVLIGSTGKTGRTLPIFNEGQGQVVLAPKGRHSEKPEEVRWRVEELFGDVPRLEMFARCKFPGWDTWGLEADGPMEAVDAVSPKLREKLEREAELAGQRALVQSVNDSDW